MYQVIIHTVRLIIPLLNLHPSLHLPFPLLHPPLQDSDVGESRKVEVFQVFHLLQLHPSHVAVICHMELVTFHLHLSQEPCSVLVDDSSPVNS